MLKTYLYTPSFVAKLLFTLSLICSISWLKAQDNSVSIGSTEVKANAVLWLNGNGAQGLLLPTVTNTGNISAPDPGMIVYQTSDHKIYYRNESSWVEIGAGAGGGGSDQTLAFNTGTGELTISGTGNTITLTGGGDLTGNLSDLQLNPEAIELADLSSMGATADQMLVFNGSIWEVRNLPSGTFSGVTTDNITITGDGDSTPLSVDEAQLDGSQITNIDYNNISSNLPTIPSNVNDLGDILTTSPSNGQVLKFDGTNWVNATDDSGGTPDADEITITAAGGTGAQLEIIDGSITTAKIANNAIGTTEIADDAITDTDINLNAAIDVTKLAGGTAGQILGTDGGGTPIWQAAGAAALPNTGDGQLLIGNGTSVSPVVTSGDAVIDNGGVITIGNNVIGSAEITDGSIATVDIDNEAVNSTKIADGTIVNADINDVAASKASVTAITNLSATDVQSALAELQGDIDGAIALPATTNGQILVNNGTSLQGRTLSGDVTIDNTGVATIASNAVNNAKIVDNSISGTKLQNNSVDTQHISANAVDGTKIANNAVGTTEITDNAVTTGKISDGTITNVDISDVAASKASVSAITNLTATNVQAALAEHQTDIDGFVDTDAQNLALTGATGSAATGEVFNVDIDNGTGVTITEGTNIAITRTGGNLTIGSTAAAAGEANTASNVGAGVGLFDSKSGADLQFNSINTASPGIINIIDDSGNSEVDIAIDQTALSIANSQVSGLGTMSTQDASGVVITNGTIDGVTLTNTNIDNTVAGNGSSLINITAEQLQGTAINPTITPAMDDVLKWNGSQWTAQPDVAAGSPNTFTGAGNPGIVPDPSTETGRFLSDDGTWTTPPGGGDMLSGNNLNDVADVTTARNNLGLGDLALQDASTVSITGGTITGIALTNTTIDNTVTGDGSMLTGISSTVTTDGATILGDGSGGTPLNIPIGGVTTTQIFDGTVSSTDIANNTIVNADVAPGAAIDVSKIAGLVDNDASNEIQNLANVLANGNNAGNTITGLTNPTNPQDAATKNYIDNLAATNNISGSFASGFTLGGDVVESSHILDGAILPSDINSPGNDMVLTSDAGGTVLWENKSNLSLVSSASNGLTLTGSNLTLGGAMTQATTFTGGGDDIYFNDFNEFIVEASLFELSDPGGDLVLSKNGLTFQIGNNSGTVDFQYRDGNQAVGRVLTSDATGIASWEVPASSPWTLNAPDINYTAGNVGIGTAIPSNPLSVVGSDAAVSSSGVFAKIQNAVNGTDAVSSGLMLGVYNSATTGTKGGIFFRRSDSFGRGDLLFSSNNIESTSSVDASDAFVKMTIKNDGDVGIGTTTPLSTLHVSSPTLAVARFEAANDPLITIFDNGTYEGFIQSFSDNMVFGTAPSSTGSIQLYAGSANRLTIQPSGNIGIGTSTLPANQKLTINHATNNYGTVHTDGTSTMGTYIGNSYVGAGSVSGGGLGTISDNPFFIYTNNNGEKFYVGNSAQNYNVGIGNNDPQSKLDVEGGITIGAAYAGSTAAPADGAIIEGRVGIGTNSPGGATQLYVQTPTSISYGILSRNDYTGGSSAYGLYSLMQGAGTGDAYGLYLSNSSTTTGTEYGIYSTGEDSNYFSNDVGIGTNAPTVALEISKTDNTGDIKLTDTYPFMEFNRTAVANNAGIFFQTNDLTDASIIHYGTPDQLRIANGTTTYLTNIGLGISRNPTTNDLEVNGTASKTASGSWLANSDRRIKTDIRDIDNSIELIKKIRPVKFKYTEEWMKRNPSIKDHYYYNFIAQEFQEVYPNAVQGSGEYLEDDSKEILQIDTYDAQITGLKALQEIIQRVEELEEENKNLKEELTTLKSSNSNDIGNSSMSQLESLKAEMAEIKAMLGMKAKKE